ncbi:uncharacterized protein BJ171DRAFT_81887 [Polychytrium aggregatum]|uniref:uncharacterized protein n=1 Tax=Polychytrium aggregatum TaxID=110093 RepID=UPI0022FDF719|nr:uncharacterized protein BJ171DRAFT_81887 [Polychytrium aggregatum]KAI9205018.1 hypothetical protein BJ171DRAFT_81887 [Polychytrium aggregatum]
MSDIALPGQHQDLYSTFTNPTCEDRGAAGPRPADSNQPPQMWIGQPTGAVVRVGISSKLEIRTQAVRGDIRGKIASVREENTGPSHPSSSATQVDDPSSDPDPVYIPQSPVPPASPAPAGSEGCRTATVGTASKYFKAAVQQPESLPSAAPISTMPASTESQRRSLAGLYKPVSLSRIVSINGPSVAAKVAGRSTSPRKNLAVGLRRKGL